MKLRVGKLKEISAIIGAAVLISGCASSSSSQYSGMPELSYKGRSLKIDPGSACGARPANFGGLRVNLIDFPGNDNFRIHFHNTNVGIGRMLGFQDDEWPEYHIFDDTGAPNAFAVNGGYGDYTVVYGANLIWKLAESFPGTDNLNTAAINATVAHEYAHIAQYIRGMRGPTKNFELMADAVSGLTARAQESQTKLKRQGLKTAQKAAYESGDYHYTSPTHHGTPKERLAAFMHGYDVADDYIDGDRIAIDRFMRDMAKKYGVSGGY